MAFAQAAVLVAEDGQVGDALGGDEIADELGDGEAAGAGVDLGGIEETGVGLDDVGELVGADELRAGGGGEGAGGTGAFVVGRANAVAFEEVAFQAGEQPLA